MVLVFCRVSRASPLLLDCLKDKCLTSKGWSSLNQGHGGVCAFNKVSFDKHKARVQKNRSLQINQSKKKKLGNLFGFYMIDLLKHPSKISGLSSRGKCASTNSCQQRAGTWEVTEEELASSLSALHWQRQAGTRHRVQNSRAAGLRCLVMTYTKQPQGSPPPPAPCRNKLLPLIQFQHILNSWTLWTEYVRPSASFSQSFYRLQTATFWDIAHCIGWWSVEITSNKCKCLLCRTFSYLSFTHKVKSLMMRV